MHSVAQPAIHSMEERPEPLTGRARGEAPALFDRITAMPTLFEPSTASRRTADELRGFEGASAASPRPIR